MHTNVTKDLTATAATPRSPADTPTMEYEALLAGLREKDRSNVERHLAFCQDQPTPDHARLWKHLLCSLAALAPQAVQTTGNRAVQFFAADGKYRVQMFALEDPRNGTLLLYADDAMEDAIRAGDLGQPSVDENDADLAQAGPRAYLIPGESGAGLIIESLSARETTSAPDYYRHMLGWNRKAVRITIPTNATAAQIATVERFCVRAARPPIR